MDSSTLTRFGLTDGEAKVYLALLSLGPSTVGPITKTSTVAPSNVYGVLDRLQEKGLVSFVTKAKMRRYQAIPPNRLGEFIRKKEQALAEEQKLLASLLPELSRIHALRESGAEAEVFVGVEGVYNAFMKLAEANGKGDWRFFYVHEPKHNAWVDDFFERLDAEFRRRSITMRGIVDEKYYSPLAERSSYMNIRSVAFPVPNNIDIYGDRVIITAWSVPLAILITNKEIADNFKTVFEDVWSRAKKSSRSSSPSK